MEPVALVADHPRLALGLIVAPYAVQAVTTAVAVALRKAGKDDTWWGAAILSLCFDLVSALGAWRGRKAPPGEAP